MKTKPNDLKLVYVLKIGNNSKGEGLYEFLFTKNLDAIFEEVDGISMPDDWFWDQKPAVDKSEPPTSEYIDEILELKTDKFNLVCLHESNDHSYMDGVLTIHCLAYETEIEEEDYDDMFEEGDDEPIMVFHYGMSLKQVENLFYERDIILHKTSVKSK